jgi:Tol biopolymer transport system component
MLRVALFTLLSAAVHTMGEPLAFVSGQTSSWSNWDIYLRDLASGVTTRLTTDPAIDNHPARSPDNQWVVFSSRRGLGEYDLWLGDVTNVEATVRQLTFHARSEVAVPFGNPHPTLVP